MVDPILQTIDPSQLTDLSSSTLTSYSAEAEPAHSPLYDRICRRSGSHSFRTNPDIGLSSSTCSSYLASSFCLAISSLGKSKVESDSSSPLRTKLLLRTIPWFNVDSQVPSLCVEDKEKLVLALHTLSNIAVAHFTTEMRLAIQEYRVACTTIDGVSWPPYIETLPVSELVGNRLPDPLSPNCVEKFGTCHLASMATPEFFEDGEWTGSFAYTGLWGVEAQGVAQARDIFDCIGGKNRLVQLNGLDRPNNRYDFVIEPVARFKTVVENDQEGGDFMLRSSFVLRSNCFYSQMGSHVLEMRVEKETGLIDIKEWNAQGGKVGERRGAVLTPFGIVGPLGLDGSWMWLWKREWSGSVEVEDG